MAVKHQSCIIIIILAAGFIYLYFFTRDDCYLNGISLGNESVSHVLFDWVKTICLLDILKNISLFQKVEKGVKQLSSGRLAAKHVAQCAKGWIFYITAKDHRFNSVKRSKLFQRLISRLTTSWVDEHVKRPCRLH